MFCTGGAPATRTYYAYLLYIDEEELCKHREAEVVKNSENSENSENLDRNLRIFDRCQTELGLKQEDIDNVGIYNWHNTLVAILSIGICRLMTEAELRSVLKVRMPNYSKEQDCKRLVSDFYKQRGHITQDNLGVFHKTPAYLKRKKHS